MEGISPPKQRRSRLICQAVPRHAAVIRQTIYHIHNCTKTQAGQDRGFARAPLADAAHRRDRFRPPLASIDDWWAIVRLDRLHSSPVNVAARHLIPVVPRLDNWVDSVWRDIISHRT